MSYISTEEILKERIKELTCLYDVSSALAKQDSAIEDKFDSICFILKNAWRFSEDSIVEFKLEHYYSTTNILPIDTIFQKVIIKIFDNDLGYIKVHYPSDKFCNQHFLNDEEKLLKKVVTDITSFYEKHLNERKEILLKRSAERIDRLSILGEITAGIAHELNTPLGNILGFAEFINEKSKEKQSQQDSAKIIKAAIYSREVVKKLMFFSCEMPQNMKFVKVIPILTEAVSLLRPNFVKASLRYEIDIEDFELEAQLDPIQFTQVLFNILINAIYASPLDTIIIIKTYTLENSFFVEVKDQGVGIDPNLKSKIFEPFFTTKPIGEGSGLGLSVVHGIVKSHKGDIITFDNKPKGTVFQVRLPLSNSK
ncbi:MAG: sensor histidine kinase [Flavobacteriaceae bacterium]|nr:sensor histidine kinase [Bacteroidota bacterium]MBX9887259.1 sensor histidine kinase [Flavobacteriaceae bacterium]